MKSAKGVIKVVCVFLITISVISSCQKFSNLNSDPNHLTIDQASPDYLMAGVLTSTATWYGNQGSGTMSGAMQQTYQDAFGSGFSGYQWDPQDWTGNYSILNNNKQLLQKSQSYGWNFHQGVALVMRAFNYGNIADYWGDAPDSMALKGDQSGLQNEFPVFDSQDTIYGRVIADLKAAIPFLNGTMAQHAEITDVTKSSDVFYGGDPVRWKKAAYSLLLRYYLRLSSKINVQASVEAIADSVFQDYTDDFSMPLSGNDQASSYQFCTKYAQQSGFNRNKMCGTLTMKLKALKDPRIIIMAEPIGTPSVVDGSYFTAGDDSTLTTIVNGVRYINPVASAALQYKQFNPATYSQDRPYGAIRTSIYNLFDTSSVYVGIPISYDYYVDFLYNLNGSGTQSNSLNAYVSYLRRNIYDNPGGSLLVQKLASYSEICFDLSEAALKGWSVKGTAKEWYYKGIEASFNTWQVFSAYQSDVDNYNGCVKDYNTYIAQDSVDFDKSPTLDRIIEQKWIASWQSCNEAYMDWRRTGLPALTIGWGSYRGAIPIRFAYSNTELQNNSANADVAIAKLQPSAYIGPDGNNSSWSKCWLLQGTNKPW